MGHQGVLEKIVVKVDSALFVTRLGKLHSADGVAGINRSILLDYDLLCVQGPHFRAIIRRCS